MVGQTDSDSYSKAALASVESIIIRSEVVETTWRGSAASWGIVTAWGGKVIFLGRPRPQRILAGESFRCLLDDWKFYCLLYGKKIRKQCCLYMNLSWGQEMMLFIYCLRKRSMTDETAQVILFNSQILIAALKNIYCHSISLSNFPILFWFLHRFQY